MPGSDQCWSHDESTADARRRRASKGGKTGGRGRKTSGEIPAIKARLLEIAEDVLAHRQSSGAAAVAGQLYNAVLRAIEVERKVKEQEDLEARLEALEDRYNEHGGSRQKWRV